MRPTVAIAGLGRMGERIVEAVRRRGYGLERVWDPDPEPHALARNPELRANLALSEADFLGTAADVVVIASTAEHHCRLLEALVLAGSRRILVEKPLGQGHDQAVRARNLASAAGARVVVNHGRRYSRGVAVLKALDGDQQAGPLRSVILRMGGGALGCVGTHWIDLCNNLMGAAPETVYARLTTPFESNPRGERFEDPGGLIILGYPGGRRTVIDSGDDVGIVGGADFLYERAQVSWHHEAGPWILRRRRAEDSGRPLSQYTLPLEQTVLGIEQPDLVEFAALAIDDALGAGAPRSGLDDAVLTMEVYAAARWAARTGQVVSLPISDEASRPLYPIP